MTACSGIGHPEQGVHPLPPEAPSWSLTSAPSEAPGRELQPRLEEGKGPSLAPTVDSDSNSGMGNLLTEVPQAWEQVRDEAEGLA